MTEQELREEVTRLAPFHHKVELPHGVSTHVSELSRRPVERTRISNLVDHAFPALLKACGGSFEGKRVLDVACNCGGFSVEAAHLKSEYVLGFDIVEHYIEQANFIKNALSLDQVDFKVMDIETIEESTVGMFDITFCFGILYHLENPIEAMKRLASVTKGYMLVDTDVMRTPRWMRPFFKEPQWTMNFPAVSSDGAMHASTSLWRTETKPVQFRPNERAVIELLKFLGFSSVEKIEIKGKQLEPRYHNGNRAAFLAVR